MRTINTEDGETIIFASNQEREEYFEDRIREADREYQDELADLLRGYQGGVQRAREAYGRLRSELETQREGSLLETDLDPAPDP